MNGIKSGILSGEEISLISKMMKNIDSNELEVLKKMLTAVGVTPLQCDDEEQDALKLKEVELAVSDLAPMQCGDETQDVLQALQLNHNEYAISEHRAERDKLTENELSDELPWSIYVEREDGSLQLISGAGASQNELFPDASVKAMKCVDEAGASLEGSTKSVADTESSITASLNEDFEKANEEITSLTVNGDTMCGYEAATTLPFDLYDTSLDKRSVYCVNTSSNASLTQKQYSTQLNDNLIVGYEKVRYPSDQDNVILSLEGPHGQFSRLDSHKSFDKSEMVLPVVQTFHPSEVKLPNAELAQSTGPFYKNWMNGYEAENVRYLSYNNALSKTQKAAKEKTLDDLGKLSGNQRSCDDTEMVVQSSNQSKNEKRYFCVFCKKTVSAIGRHLTTIHQKEPEVLQANNLPKKSTQRMKILANLRNRGLFEHNSDLNYNRKVFIACRRPNAKYHKTPTDFKSCLGCYGPYSKRSLRHHVNKCTHDALKGERSTLVLARMVERRIHTRAGYMLTELVFPKLREDEIIRLIRFDWLVIVYGNKLCQKYPPHYQHDLIRAKLRLAGRLLYNLKNFRPEVDGFASIFQPKYYESLVDAIHIIGKFDPCSNYYGSPSTAAAAVTQIREVANILIAEYIKQENAEWQQKTENFLKLFNAEVSADITRAVLTTLAKMRRERREELPITEDIKLLVKYLDSERKNCFRNLKEAFSYPDWLKLSALTMVSIIVFNRRRIGETQNILVKDFDLREKIDEQLSAALSDHDKEIAKMYSRMKVRGKKGRTVPVLLKPHIEQCIELIKKHRVEAGVPANNDFLFGLPTPTITPNIIKVIDACDQLRKFSVNCGAKKPETLRGTKLRKHMATVCISLELTDNSVSEVAEFMGHHERIHRDYYRQSPIVREVVKMSQLLEFVSKADHPDDENEDDDDDDQDQNSMEVHLNDDGAFIEEIHSFAGEDVIPAKKSKAGGQKSNKTKTTNPSEKKKIVRRKWTAEEVAAAHKIFGSYFEQRKLPSSKVINAGRIAGLQTRTDAQIKTWICNQLRKEC